MATGNRIKAARKAFANDPNFKRLKKLFTPKRFKPVTPKREGKKR
jgi:hypothetical protein